MELAFARSRGNLGGLQQETGLTEDGGALWTLPLRPEMVLEWIIESARSRKQQTVGNVCDKTFTGGDS
jgi:hypothetical protein